MTFTGYDSQEEMQEALRQSMAAADAQVEAWQSAMQVGNAFVKAFEDLVIVGEVIDPGEDAVEIYQQEHMKHFRFTRCWSVACPEGEMGDTHVSEFIRRINPVMLQHVKDSGYDNKVLGIIKRVSWTKTLNRGVVHILPPGQTDDRECLVFDMSKPEYDIIKAAADDEAESKSPRISMFPMTGWNKSERVIITTEETDVGSEPEDPGPEVDRPPLQFQIDALAQWLSALMSLTGITFEQIYKELESRQGRSEMIKHVMEQQRKGDAKERIH